MSPLLGSLRSQPQSRLLKAKSLRGKNEARRKDKAERGERNAPRRATPQSLIPQRQPLSPEACKTGVPCSGAIASEKIAERRLRLGAATFLSPTASHSQDAKTFRLCHAVGDKNVAAPWLAALAATIAIAQSKPAPAHSLPADDIIRIAVNAGCTVWFSMGFCCVPH
jgi:hypothetical protein